MSPAPSDLEAGRGIGAPQEAGQSSALSHALVNSSASLPEASRSSSGQQPCFDVSLLLLSPPPSGLELCDPLHRLMASMVGGFFSIFAEVLLPAVAALCRDWPVLQAVATLPLLQLLSCWW